MEWYDGADRTRTSVLVGEVLAGKGENFSESRTGFLKCSPQPAGKRIKWKPVNFAVEFHL
jgi:hypothetical protein